MHIKLCLILRLYVKAYSKLFLYILELLTIHGFNIWTLIK